jgi:predicted O-methyltransferase YrrM
MGSDEHVRDNESIGLVEKRFDIRLANYTERLRKAKSSTFDFFSSGGDETFDIIYVDASHKYEDVLYDLEHSLEKLKPGGLLIADDYLWISYATLEDNPCLAINKFARDNQGALRTISVSGQVVFQKI